MIYFYSGRTEFGGSTLILDSVVRLLNEGGLAAEFYGKHDWHTQLSQFNRKGEPRPSPDDVLVSHMKTTQHRPDVRRSIYYCHEPKHNFQWTLGRCWGCDYAGEFRFFGVNNRGKVQTCPKCRRRTFEFDRPTAYDLTVFSSVNHEFKARVHQSCWGPSTIIPNPVEVDFAHEPPAEPTAGIVGTVGERKQPHVSIREAQRAGFRKILLYGNREDRYFEDYIRPQLSDDIRYMGLEMDKRKIYNSVSEVFHYSTQEQAAMVLGECQQLGIPFHCSPEVMPWTVHPRREIFRRWKDLLT